MKYGKYLGKTFLDFVAIGAGLAVGATGVSIVAAKVVMKMVDFKFNAAEDESEETK